MRCRRGQIQTKLEPALGAVPGRHAAVVQTDDSGADGKPHAEAAASVAATRLYLKEGLEDSHKIFLGDALSAVPDTQPCPVRWHKIQRQLHSPLRRAMGQRIAHHVLNRALQGLGEPITEPRRPRFTFLLRAREHALEVSSVLGRWHR